MGSSRRQGGDVAMSIVPHHGDPKARVKQQFLILSPLLGDSREGRGYVATPPNSRPWRGQGLKWGTMVHTDNGMFQKLLGLVHK